MSPADYYFHPSRLTILPGIDVIPESSQYRIREADRDGTIILHDPEGQEVFVYFKVVTNWNETQLDALNLVSFYAIMKSALDRHLIENYSIFHLQFDLLEKLHLPAPPPKQEENRDLFATHA